MRLDLEDGKYTMLSEGGKMQALRYGEQWRDLTGDKLIGALMSHIEELEGKLATPTAPSMAGALEPGKFYVCDGSVHQRHDAAKPKVEAVAEIYRAHYGGRVANIGHNAIRELCNPNELPVGTKLYAAPPQPQPEAGRVGLTEEQIDALDTFSLHWMAPRNKESVREFARAIERAHGIPAAKE